MTLTGGGSRGRTRTHDSESRPIQLRVPLGHRHLVLIIQIHAKNLCQLTQQP